MSAMLTVLFVFAVCFKLNDLLDDFKRPILCRAAGKTNVKVAFCHTW